MSTFFPSLKGFHKEVASFQRSVERDKRMVRERWPLKRTCEGEKHRWGLDMRKRIETKDEALEQIMMDIRKWIKIKSLDLRLSCF